MPLHLGPGAATEMLIQARAASADLFQGVDLNCGNHLHLCADLLHPHPQLIPGPEGWCELALTGRRASAGDKKVPGWLDFHQFHSGFTLG